jgi:hypothetical protein
MLVFRKKNTSVCQFTSKSASKMLISSRNGFIIIPECKFCQAIVEFVGIVKHLKVWLSLAAIYKVMRSFY